MPKQIEIIEITKILGSLAFCALIAHGCASDRGESMAGPGGMGSDGDGTGGDGTADDGGDEGDDDGHGGSGDGGDDDGDDGDGGGNEGSACGEPIDCGDLPSAPGNVGLGSFAPYGCGGDVTFTKTWSQESGGSGAKAVPIVGDLDGDGDADVFMNPRKGGAWIFRGNGDGTFEFHGNPPGLSFVCGWGSDLGDFDGDGNIDLFMGDHCEGARAWTNQGNLNFANAETGLPAEGTFSGCGLADLNGDGNLDALCGADQFGTGYKLVFGDGAGSWTEQSMSGIPAWESTDGPHGGPLNIGHFEFADFDHDGDLDAFAMGQYGGGKIRVYIFRNEGDGLSWSPLTSLTGGTTSWMGVTVQGALGDLNCDGEVDVAAGGTIYLGNGGSWQNAAVVNGAELATLGDIDGDGYLDLITQSKGEPAASHGLRLYLNDGTGTSWDYVDDSGLSTDMWEPHGIDVADVDHNGTLDIVRWAEVSNNMHVLEAWAQNG